MSSKKLARAWGAIRIKYPVFQVFGSRKRLTLIFGFVALAVFAAVLWAVGALQSFFKLPPPPSGVPDNLFSTVIEVSIFLMLGIGLLMWKTIGASEEVRIDNKYSVIDDALIFPFSADLKVDIQFDKDVYYQQPPMIEASLRWVEFDKEEFFLVEAGSLDIPKLTLIKVTTDEVDKTLKLELGAASFYDIFYTHYSPDLVFSSQYATEVKEVATLRALYGKPLFNYYKKEIGECSSKQTKINCSSLIPNPLGISGIVLIRDGALTYAVLRIRGSHEIAAKNRIEWSFAGLVEATEWIHHPEIDFEEFVHWELDDEVVAFFKELEGKHPKIMPLGLVINSLYMYQPEIFVVVEYNSVDIAAIKSQLPKQLRLVDVRNMQSEFKHHQTKNLCEPGLKLLRHQRPELFG
ncbi:hypothetical protein [Shewanella sp. YIC-542]|uniref:hypothetical protein n=1 Tax=Shewanella mytili TaxID=3377111 RepID=UPI00398F67EB